MKRTTIILPDEMEARLRREARRRQTSMAEIAREALTAYLPPPTEGRLSFTAIGESEEDDTAARAEEIVAELISRRHP